MNGKRLSQVMFFQFPKQVSCLVSVNVSSMHRSIRLTVEDLIGEVLAEAKECLKPGIIDGFFSSEILIKKSLLKSIEQKS